MGLSWSLSKQFEKPEARISFYKNDSVSSFSNVTASDTLQRAGGLCFTLDPIM